MERRWRAAVAAGLLSGAAAPRPKSPRPIWRAIRTPARDGKGRAAQAGGRSGRRAPHGAALAVAGKRACDTCRRIANMSGGRLTSRLRPTLKQGRTGVQRVSAGPNNAPECSASPFNAPEAREEGR